MRTSYYANVPQDYPGAIAISLYPPRGTRYQQYKKLAPSTSLLRQYKQGIVGKLEYTRIYNRQLAELDPREVWSVLHHIAGEGVEPVLLCYEGVGQFCHRRLVAQWFEKAFPGIEVAEGLPGQVAIAQVEQLTLL